MPHSSRREYLEARHAAIENKIRMEQSSPGANAWFIGALKKQKLHLKDQIEGIAG